MKKNIIITGGGLVNKGAQAMTFIVVDEMKKRYPDYEIYLLSAVDMSLPKEIKEQYAFKFMGWYPLKFAKCQSNPLQRAICLLRNKNELLECENIYKNCEMMIDISGYALGSNWSSKICLDYLENFEFAKAFNIPVYLMPQSFGPFEFEGQAGVRIHSMIERLFPGFKWIYAREKEGYEELVRTFNLDNVSLAPDMVLNNKGINLSSVYKSIVDIKVPDIKEGSVGLIPNMRNVEVGDKQSVLDLYSMVIEQIISKNRKVYLLAHSNVDRELCVELKNQFFENEKVTVLEEDFSCLQYSELVKRFDFIVASRFHSIVHAYKNGIPCVAIGWATKYKELMKPFKQERFMFDIRECVNEEMLMHQLNYMHDYYLEESRKIISKLENMQKNNIFDVIQK